MKTAKQRSAKLAANIAASQKEIAAVLAERRRSIKGAVYEYTSSEKFIKSAAVRNKLYAELSAEYKALNSQVNDWVESGVKVTSKNFWEYAKADLPQGAVSGTFGKFSERYLADLVAVINPSSVDKQVAINANLGGMLTKDIRTLRAAVSTTIAEGAVEGLTYPEMSKRMIEKVRSVAKDFQFVDAAGRNRSAEDYFGMLNRTMHAQAARETYSKVLTETGSDLVRVDGTSTYPDSPCIKYEGEILSLTGSTPGYTTVAEAEADGLFHPNCIHTLSAALESEIEAAKER